MRKIEREETPECLKKIAPSTNWEKFRQENRDCYKAIVQSLLKEQHYLCCYCESSLKKGKNHVDHLHPKSRNPKLTCVYGNMAYSCDNTHEHCGHHRVTRKWDERLFCAPNDSKYKKNLFRYDDSGEVYPSAQDPKIAQEMINSLNLNHENLVNKRKTIAKAIKTSLKGNDNAVNREFLRDNYLKVDSDNRLQPHPSLCEQLLPVE